MKDELNTLNLYLSKKRISYAEFNELIGNYFVQDYEELEDNYYLLKIIRPLNEENSTYTDYIEVIK
ncbi:MAG: hypothetical protein ACRC92_12015 [Peptostreptococcaceae bacterium]